MSDILEIPAHFFEVASNGASYPGAEGVEGFACGANCQHFAYELLRHFGLNVPNFRSSRLWEDEQYTHRVTDLEPLDLLLFNESADPWGAHVAVYCGEGCAIHLSEAVGHPVIWALEEFYDRPKYRLLVGAKRILPEL